MGNGSLGLEGKQVCGPGHQCGGQPHSRRYSSIRAPAPSIISVLPLPASPGFPQPLPASSVLLKALHVNRMNKQKNPKPSAINDGESRIKKHSLLLLRSELRVPVFTTSIQHSTGSPSQSNQARKKIKGIHWKEKSNLCSEIT